MGLTRESTVELAKKDLAKRLGVDAAEVKKTSICDRDFPDMSLGAPVDGEMSAQMISSGWQIELAVGSKKYEYRADKYQVRLHNFKGENFVILT
jgi:hypothetical protein